MIPSTKSPCNLSRTEGHSDLQDVLQASQQFLARALLQGWRHQGQSAIHQTMHLQQRLAENGLFDCAQQLAQILTTIQSSDTTTLGRQMMGLYCLLEECGR